jgi:hypothetical protein
VNAQRHRVPSYRLHKASGQGIATFNGRDVYFGLHADPKSKEMYDRFVPDTHAIAASFGRCTGSAKTHASARCGPIRAGQWVSENPVGV